MSEERLVVIDMQEGFLENKPRKDVESVVTVIENLVAWARKSNIPITFTMFPEDRYGALVSQMSPKSGEIITKNDSSAFSSPEFCQKMQGAWKLYVTGANVHACVGLTVKEAAKRNLEVVVFRNATLYHEQYLAKTVQTWLSLMLTHGVHITNFLKE